MIDPHQQQAMVDSQGATERQKKALYDYDAIELNRQKKLFDAGVTSRDALDQAQQANDNAKADYEAALQPRNMQAEQLGYYTVRAPFDGVVGDIPVHVGDYVSPSAAPATILTTVDQPGDLEAYIYIPTERSSQARIGLDVELFDTAASCWRSRRSIFFRHRWIRICRESWRKLRCIRRRKSCAMRS